MKTPIYQGLAQSDLDMNHFNLLNWSGGGGGGGSGLDANTVTADDIGLVGDGVTDNSTALQTWLNSVGAAKVNSTLLVPEGVYIFSGPLQDTGRRNAQILFPSNAFTDRHYSITIKGYHPVPFIPWSSVSMPVPSGPIFRSTLASGGGTQPAFFGGMGPHVPGTPDGLGADLSFMIVRFGDMIFQTVANPQISCLNLSRISEVEMTGDILIMAGTKYGENDVVQPTTSTSYGVIFPYEVQGLLRQVQNLSVSNFYTGARFSEANHILNMSCWICYYAVEFGFGYHSSQIDRLIDLWGKNGIRVTGANDFSVQQHFIERAFGTPWYQRIYDLVDPSNLATADITWYATQGGSPTPPTSYNVQGGANAIIRRVGFPADTVYVGTDMRLVAITGGAKLQARNPGTGTWADVDQWTNP